MNPSFVALPVNVRSKDTREEGEAPGVGVSPDIRSTRGNARWDEIPDDLADTIVQLAVSGRLLAICTLDKRLSDVCRDEERWRLHAKKRGCSAIPQEAANYRRWLYHYVRCMSPEYARHIDEQFVRYAKSGDIDGAAGALRSGADVHTRNDTALRLAALNRHTNVVRLLLDSGADVDANSGIALYMASFEGDVEVARLLLHRDADIHLRNDAALRVAVEGRGGRHLAMVRFLLDQGANVHALDDEPLVTAVVREDLEMVRLLLDRGADARANGNQPLIVAIGVGNLDVIKLLIERGADGD